MRTMTIHTTILRATTLITIVLASLLALALTSAGSVAGATAKTASGCSIPHKGEHLGPTYLTSLSVTATSCSTGRIVVREYHNCQLKHGGVKAKCTSKVDGFSCQEKRGPSIPTEFYSTVSCQSGSRRVNYKYSQFT